MKPLTILTAVLATVLSNCAPVTPEARINASPAVFESLSESHQTLVREGRIAKGMPPQAVELALGKPHSKTQGSSDGEAFERWEYTSLEPVYFSNFGTIPYYSPYGPSFGYNDASSVAYVPRVRGMILFRKGKVSGWEMLR